MKFRHDINGLRAIAVVAVVLFHFYPSLLTGGFAGVDVFFVISGYLMTGIIFRGFRNDDFCLVKFYVARANRIIPALATLCIVLLVFGWFSFTPVDYSLLAEHVRSSVGFYSNAIFWSESGYFDIGSHEKWLLHTWSLSAEWQFYIFYPVVLLGLKKFLSLEHLKSVVVLGTLVGFAGSIFASVTWPEAAYFLLPTRAWEMMFGGLAFLYPVTDQRINKKTLEVFGIALIASSYLFVSSDSIWPGYLALIPVMGTYLVILANRQSSILTNNVIFQALGKWSYSIYLWHWPIAVAGVTYNLGTLTLFGPFLSIVAGALSYKYIESCSFRRVEWVKDLIKAKPLHMVICLVCMSLLITHYEGIKSELRPVSITEQARLQDQYRNYVMDPSGMFDICNAAQQIYDTGMVQVSDQCIAEKKGGIFLWGDSHIGSLSTGLRNHIRPEELTMLTSSGCEPSFTLLRSGVSRSDVGCNFSNALASELIQSTKPEVVILGMSSDHERNDWLDTITELKLYGVKKIIVIGPLPQWRPSLPSIYAKRHMGKEYIEDSSFDSRLLASNEFLLNLTNGIPDVTYVDVISDLCTETQNSVACKVKVGDELLAFDYGHLTISGSLYISNRLLVSHLR